MPTKREGRRGLGVYIPLETWAQIEEYARATAPTFANPNKTQAVIDLVNLGFTAWKENRVNGTGNS